MRRSEPIALYESGSFLKKRTKKLLIPLGHGPGQPSAFLAGLGA
jgi:hypothetical protein